MDRRKLNILIAGGGTGGHLFPGIAVARAFLKTNPESRILFVGTDRPFEKSILARNGFDHRAIDSAGVKGLGLLKKVRAVAKIPGSVAEAANIIKKFKPDLVLGVGGYSSGPVALAARLSGVKVVLHEQNILPGITNRIVSGFSARVYVSFPESAARFNPEKVRVTGNPVRDEILQAGTRREPDRSGRFTVLVCGGSQGAAGINRAVTSALDHIREKERFHFIHQSGTRDEERVKKSYGEKNFSFKVKPFFDNMADCYAEADLIICRAGATTIAEISAMGHSAIFIPFPHAADNHQEKNARSLVNAGAAEMIREEVLDGKTLAERIGFYAQNPAALQKMAGASRRYGKPHAAETIVDDCYRLVETSA